MWKVILISANRCMEVDIGGQYHLSHTDNLDTGLFKHQLLINYFSVLNVRLIFNLSK